MKTLLAILLLSAFAVQAQHYGRNPAVPNYGGNQSMYNALPNAWGGYDYYAPGQLPIQSVPMGDAGISIYDPNIKWQTPIYPWQPGYEHRYRR